MALDKLHEICSGPEGRPLSVCGWRPLRSVACPALGISYPIIFRLHCPISEAKLGLAIFVQAKQSDDLYFFKNISVEVMLGTADEVVVRAGDKLSEASFTDLENATLKLTFDGSRPYWISKPSRLGCSCTEPEKLCGGRSTRRHNINAETCFRCIFMTSHILQVAISCHSYSCLHNTCLLNIRIHAVP